MLTTSIGCLPQFGLQQESSHDLACTTEHRVRLIKAGEGNQGQCTARQKRYETAATGSLSAASRKAGKTGKSRLHFSLLRRSPFTGVRK